MKPSIAKKDRENRRAMEQTAANRERRKRADELQKKRDADPTCNPAYKTPTP